MFHMTRAVYDGDVLVIVGSSSAFTVGVENDCMVEKSLLVEHGVGPEQCSKMKAQNWVSQQRGFSGSHRWQDGPAKGRTG